MSANLDLSGASCCCSAKKYFVKLTPLQVSWNIIPLPQTQILYGEFMSPAWAGIAQSVQRLVTGWTVRGSDPGSCEIFRNRTHRPWGPPSLLYNGYRVFPVRKAAGAWRWLPTPSSAAFKERVELYLYSLYGPSWPVLGWTLPLPLPYVTGNCKTYLGLRVKCPIFLFDFNQIWILLRQNMTEVCNNKFHDNPSRANRAAKWRQTGRTE